jgi:hypothetical protein
MAPGNGDLGRRSLILSAALWAVADQPVPSVYSDHLALAVG